MYGFMRGGCVLQSVLMHVKSAAACHARVVWNCLQLVCPRILPLLLLPQGTAVLKGNFDIKSLELVLSTLQVGHCFVMFGYVLCPCKHTGDLAAHRMWLHTVVAACQCECDRGVFLGLCPLAA
jgi:hypothetical protein